MIGHVLIIFAFSASLLSALMYFLAFRTANTRYLTPARYAYHGAAVSVIATCSFLDYLILTHQFQFTYVWNYSSTNLPTPLLLSTFYAGQEGIFSFWALYTSII
jgi:cytochrome c-type biogenesis protein CcmF